MSEPAPEPVESDEPLEPRDLGSRARTTGLAVGYGAIAGAVSGLTLLVMQGAQHLIWSGNDAWWFSVLVIGLGGCLVAGLRAFVDDRDLDAQIAQSADPLSLRRRKIALLALSATIAVGFGGAIGPEAGLLAVVSELSAIVSVRIARSHAEATLIGRSGTAGALAGLYSSPPGAVAYDDDTLAPPKVLLVIAAAAGFVAFALVMSVGGSGGLSIGIPDYRIASATDLLWAALPAAAGAAAGWVYLRVRRLLSGALARCGPIPVQTLVATALFAALAAVVPLVRFSGHHDFATLAQWSGSGAWAALAGLAIAKILATALCVAGGWRGGEFFPLLFIGGAAGAACSALVADLPIAVGLVAGLAAATTMGLRRPLAVLLICVFVVEGQALGALLVGVLLAAVLCRLTPAQDAPAPAVSRS